MSSDAAAEVGLVQALYLLLKAGMSYADADHPAVVNAADRMHHAVARMGGPFSLQFVAQAAFRDFELIPLDHDGFARSRQIFAALDNLGAHELTFLARGPESRTLAQLGVLMARGARGPSDILDDMRLPGLAWRAIPHTAWGSQTEEIDAEVFAIAQVALAVNQAEGLVGAQPWDFSAGVGVVRRLERALEVSVEGTERAIELAPTRWTIARRVVSATYTVLRTLGRVDVTKSTRRAAAHAALTLACAGLADRAGEEASVAAERALPAMESAPERARTGISPHRLKTTALVNALLDPNPTRWLPVTHLVLIAYDLELQRSPRGVDFELTRGDLLAYAAQEMGLSYAATWVKLLVSCFDVCPAGAFVRLADGRVGVVMSSEENPLRPRVMIDGQVFVPSADVQLVSTAEVRGVA